MADLPRAELTAVEASSRSKWGMGGIPHSGRIWVHLRSGQQREFILLGVVIPEQIRDRIVTGGQAPRSPHDDKPF